MKRLLVTTALEETWGDDVPVLFLGEWCRLYNRKSIWSGMDALVADPFGVEPEEELRDVVYINDLGNKILTELAEALNEYHMVQYSERYWNIIIGPWLKLYMGVAFNRYYTLDQALKNYDVSGTAIFKDASYDLGTSDSKSFVGACDEDWWNHVFYSRIMSFRGDMELNQVLASFGQTKSSFDAQKKESGLPLGIVNRMVKKFAMGLASLSSKFYSDTDAFIASSYLPIKEEIKLQLALGQIPKLWRSPSFKQTKADSGQRASLVFDCEQFEGFEKYVRWQLPEVIPACFLEGYVDLVKRAEEMPWPKQPKFIFTSSWFFFDEIFKAWAALKVEQGTPYFAGQHGNNYGTHFFHGNKGWSDRVASDKFITWGWAESEKEIPAFIFTCAGKKPRQYDKTGGLLLIENSRINSIYHYDCFHRFAVYMEKQFRFVANLPEHIHQKLTVRLHAQYFKMCSFEDMRWKDRSPNTKIELGTVKIKEMIKQSRLVVHSYDSTGILETLAMDIPTMCFWRGGLNHLLPSAKPYYELLADVGILFYSPESAAKFISLHWDDISGWWKSKKVQDARQIFCDKYARTVADPVQKLKDIFTENSCNEIASERGVHLAQVGQ